MDPYAQPSETDPLLPVDPPVKKPFYRPRPLWIVPFALTSALVHGMTAAPRVQVYTQLACNVAYGKQPHDRSDYILPPHLSSTLVPALEHATVTPIPVHFPHFSHIPEHTYSEDPRQVLSNRCFSDPAVQAGAARLQTIMATIMGVLSVCTTAWWSHYGQKHGRTKVLAASTLGTLFTDLAFVVASTHSSPFLRHGHKFLFLASMLEGILGGQPTLHTAISAYISDCTSDGSRAHIFSRFAGVSYVGIALGPTIGALLIRHPLVHAQSFGRRRHNVQSVTAVFWAAVLCNAINLIMTLLVIPESLAKVRLRAVQKGDIPTPSAQKKPGLKKRLLGPLAIFAPRKRVVNGRLQEDWSMSWLAISMFTLFLAHGVFQVKYLYAEHTFGWGAEQLGYYISFIGNVRAIHTLVLMPFIISCFKPSLAPSTPTHTSNTTCTYLAHSIFFDLYIARASLVLDLISHTLVALHLSSSPFIFAGLTSISALASSTTPALQSLAICILQRSSQGNPDIGALFSGLSTLTALGHAIFAPLIFGFVYSSTVARFPEAVFALAAALVLMAFLAILFIRPEPRCVRKGKATVVVTKRRRMPVTEFERGRSRTVKHIGDRVRTPARLHAPTRYHISAGDSEAMASCSCSGPSDDAV